MKETKKSAGSNCEYCMNYEYDEDYEYYVCTQDLDQDEMYRLSPGSSGNVRITVRGRVQYCKKTDVVCIMWLQRYVKRIR